MEGSCLLSDKSLGSYAIISPVRDEQEHIGQTLNSVVSQTIPPRQWIIVDDGSNDQTPTIVSEYAKIFPWIQLIHRKDRSFYHLGAGVIEALIEGLDYVELSTVEFIGKLDGDLV